MVNLGDITRIVSQNFSLNEALEIGKPLSIFIIGIAIYSFFIFKFYRFLAKRDVTKLDLSKYNTSNSPALTKTFAFFGYILTYIIIYPIITFFWFMALALILAFLSKNQGLETILLISVALVSAVRITSYYSEDLSKDLAKMLPFALLGVFLVDISFFSFSDSINLIKSFPEMWKSAVYYLLYIVLLESILKIFSSILIILGMIDEETKENKY